MSPRDTSTGKVLENMIMPALVRGRYSYKTQTPIGKRLGGRTQVVDILVASPSGEVIPVSTKWQQTSGTAEQKVPFEIMCLADAIHRSNGKLARAYLVLGGAGWTLRDFYTSGEVHNYLRNCESVSVVTLETFVAKANTSKL